MKPNPKNEQITAQLERIDGFSTGVFDKQIFQPLIDLCSKNVVIGRGTECDVVWFEMEVANKHLQLEYLLKHWYIRALCKQGVFVNGKLAPKGTLVKLSNNDVIGLSTTDRIRYKLLYVQEPGAKAEPHAGSETTGNKGDTAGEAGSINVLKIMGDELCCAICNEIMIDPTGINCGHSFCNYCIEEWRQRGKYNCPVCRKLFQTTLRQIHIENLLDKMFQSLPANIQKDRFELLEERRKEVEAQWNGP